MRHGDDTPAGFTDDGERVVRVRGDASNALSHGYTCPKGRNLGAWHHHPDRLDRPLLRDATGALLATMSGHAAAVLGAEFSADGTRVLTTCQDGVTRVWNLNGQMLAELRLGDGEELYYGTWSPDGRSVVATGSNGAVRVWRAVDWTAFEDPVESEEDFEAQLARVRSGG